MVRSFFCMWRPCRADEEPVGSPHCGAMARGGLAAEVFPALGFRLCLLNFCFGSLAGWMKDPSVRATPKTACKVVPHCNL